LALIKLIQNLKIKTNKSRFVNYDLTIVRSIVWLACFGKNSLIPLK